jgi:hypothetical protein
MEPSPRELQPSTAVGTPYYRVMVLRVRGEGESGAQREAVVRGIGVMMPWSV